MNILYCGDGNIRDGVILSAVSLAEHTEEALHIYILTASVTTAVRSFVSVPADFAAYLQTVLRQYHPDSTVTLRDISHLFDAEMPRINAQTRFTPLCMLRLFADQVPELPDKILYLDNDVLCRDDPMAFYRQDLSGYELAGCLDYYGSWFFRKNWLRRDYLNSGVLLLNMPRIRETGLFTGCRKMCCEKKMFMPDQSAINKLCARKAICPRKYNEQRKLHNDTVFQHFTTSFRLFPVFHKVTVKPWDISRVHSVLKLREYDGLFEKYERIKEKYYANRS